MFVDAKQLPWPVKQRLASKGYSIPVARTLDQIVVSFLTLHDVSVRPVNFSQGSNVSAALIAATYGPLMMSQNAMMKGQAKAASLQEWTSWKQWALSHPDFQAFKEGDMVDFKNELARINDYVNSPEGAAFIASIEAERKASLASEQIVMRWLLLSMVVIGFGAYAYVAIHGAYCKSIPQPSKSSSPVVKIYSNGFMCG